VVVRWVCLVVMLKLVGGYCGVIFLRCLISSCWMVYCVYYLWLVGMMY